MGRGAQLQVLVTDLRAEIGHSTTTNLGVNMLDSLKQVLSRTQDRLWADYDWPFLRSTSDKQLAAGSRYYDIPQTFVLERIESVHVKDGGNWSVLSPGISLNEYNVYDSDAGDRLSPVLKWEPYGTSQIEVWPLPDANGVTSTLEGYIRFTGIKNLSQLVSDTDTADLDDRLIVLHAAAEFLARQGAKDADAKFQLAQLHYKRLKARLSTKRRFSMSDAAVRPQEKLTAKRI
tara:strand:- start:5405 stop:6100 length:696 start_codon:yes stop_codon:yes gene_type:complete